MEYEAGPELDALIGRRVFGIIIVGGQGYYTDADGHRVTVESASIPLRHCQYSTDIGAAWAVVEHMRAAGWVVECQGVPDSAWVARLIRHRDVQYVRASADTMSLAICRAALAVKTLEDNHVQ